MTDHSEVEDLRRRLAQAEATVAGMTAADEANALVHARLMAETQLLREAQRLSGVGSWAFDPRTGATTWSEELFRIYGIEPGEIDLGPTTYLDVMRPEDAARMRDVAQASVAAGQPYELEFRVTRPDGQERVLKARGSAETDTDGTPLRFAGTTQDITDMTRAREDLTEARDLFQQLLSTATEQAVVAFDLDQRLTIFNRGAERMLGWTAAELMGTRAAERIHTPAELPSLAECFERIASGEEPEAANRRWTYVRQDGTQLRVRLTVSPMRGPDGEITGHLGIATDVTEQLRAERGRDSERERAEVEAQRAMRAMGEARDRAVAANGAKNAFLATMSHEIRTPMNAVIGLSGLLLDTRLDDQQYDLAETVRRSGEHLMTIINDILDFSKVEAGELDLEARPFDLRSFAGRTVNRFEDRAAGLHLAVEVEDDCPVKVVGDETRLRQVLGNLVDNAVKFTTEGGVMVRFTLVGPDPADAGRDVLQVDVRDTGIGIADADVDRLFQPFTQVDGSTTRTYGGTGLGLAICRGIVEAMGGELWAESEVGAGSVFSFTVPVGRVAAGTPAAPPHVFEEERPVAAVPSQGGGAGSLRILLVEDNEVNQKVGTMMLAKLGHRADIAQNGELALQATRAVRYDMVLMDMHMPVMDGLEATRRIRTEVPPERQPFIVAVTASVTREDREACAAAGMNAYIPKPIQITELSAVLSEYTLARAAAASHP